MQPVCVVVADSARARFFAVEAPAGPRGRPVLVERDALDNPDLRQRGTEASGRPRTETNTDRAAGPVHPIGAQRERHRVELTRRFAAAVVERAAALAAETRASSLMLVAEPRMLGMLREMSARAVHPGVEVRELAKDLSALTAPEISLRLFDEGGRD